MITDSPQREEALDPSRSFIVEAPAGSGKTGLLVQRVLRLLSGVDRPEMVVAMTFTRKAASEMKERIVTALREAGTGAAAQGEFAQRTRELALAVLAQDRQKGWRLLADPGRLQIQTIDSLCAMLTRQMPVLSAFGGVGEVVEDPTELYTMAAREMLLNLTEGSAEEQSLFHRMALHFDNDAARLEGHLVKMLSKRDQWEQLSAGNDTQLLADFCLLLQKAWHCLLSVFQRSGKVDFVEIARAAQRSLGEPEAPTDLLYSLDYRIQHLLVDEFQDTSRAQYNLVKALTEQWSAGDGHTLFLVGDPMQSIYGFREADVSLFLRSWQDCRLGSVPLSPIRLETNFRTTAPILDWVQSAFSDAMPEDNLQIGAVKFRESKSGRDAIGPAPQLFPFVDDGGGAEAEQIVKILKKEKGTVAILVRSRTQITSILPALRNAGIPYEAIDIDHLREQQHIIDLLSLTRAILHVADRVSWLACLRAPWCGLKLSDLSALAEADQKSTVLDLLSNPETMAKLSVDGRWRAVRVHEALVQAIENLGKSGLRPLLERTWRQLGGAASLTAAHQLEDAGTYFDMLESMEEGGTILDFSLFEEKLDSLFARPAEKDCHVKVMTAYQAKGLEFDTVIVPQLGRDVRRLDKELLVWTEEQGELSIAALPKRGEDEAEYKRINDVREQKDLEETKRLFYVACTRAKNNLYLLGNVKAGKEQCNTPGKATFLRLLWAKVEPQFAGVYRSRTIRQANLFNSQNQGRTFVCRLPLTWKAAAAEPSIHWQPAVRRMSASSRPTTYAWVSDTGRHKGTVVHALLKRITADGLDAWNAVRVGSMSAVIGSELLRLGVAADEHDSAAKQVVRAVNQTLESSRGRWILANHADQYSEWAIASGEVTGTVDRAFRGDDGRYWIIDFKTSEHKGAGLEDFLSSEKRRYREQLDRYAAVISNLKNGPIWLGLYFPLLDSWLEWEYTAAAAAAS